MSEDTSESAPTPEPLPPRRWTDRALDFVEWLGNKLPDPVVLFLIALILVWIASALLAPVAFSEIDPRTMNQATPPRPIEIKNQLSGTSLLGFLTKMVKTFVDFPPLGMVLVVLLGVGVAEHTGLVNACVKGVLSVTPAKLLTPMLVLVGLFSHAAADSGYVVVIPLGAVIFAAAGRHPLAGIAASFAAISGGLSANFIPIMLDPLLQGFTEPAAQILDPNRNVNPLCNYYFTIGSGFVILALTWYITDCVIEPRLKNVPVDGDPADVPKLEPLTRREWAGLGAGLGTLLGMLLLLTWSCLVHTDVWLPPGEKPGETPLIKAIVPLMFLLFLFPGIVYGYVAGTVKSHRDIIQGMSKAMGTMSYYLVLAFFAAQFIHAFTESNVGILIAMSAGNFLKQLNVPVPMTLVGIVLLTTCFNLLIGSASAKWALLGPILVPMLMQMGLSPELTQASYRVGDSCTNIVTPLMPYFPLVVVFCQKYVKGTGIGTLVSLMLPYSLAFLVAWTLLLIGYWSLGIPLGIEGGFTYP